MNDATLLEQVIGAYCREPSRWLIEPVGAGNINDTYLVRRAGNCFILQRINDKVFSRPLRVIENFEKITSHLVGKSASGGDRVEVAAPVKTLTGASHFIDVNGRFWRAQTYIPHKSRKTLTDKKQARQVGRILGCFHHQLSDLDGTELTNPLPGFHNLPLYLRDFDKVCQNLNRETAGDLQYCLETVDRYRAVAPIFEHGVDAGILRRQPVHGDPKVDNFLFNERIEPFGLVDLDTVGMGLVHHDLGDCLRSCCNQKGEGGENSGDVVFDLGICKALLDGYFSVDREMGEEQRRYVFDAVLLICFELGLRFLTDHLAGNQYFKIHSENDNLLRAVRQFRLTADVAGKERQIRRLVASVAAG